MQCNWTPSLLFCCTLILHSHWTPPMNLMLCLIDAADEVGSSYNRIDHEGVGFSASTERRGFERHDRHRLWLMYMRHSKQTKHSQKYCRRSQLRIRQVEGINVEGDDRDQVGKCEEADHETQSSKKAAVFSWIDQISSEYPHNVVDGEYSHHKCLHNDCGSNPSPNSITPWIACVGCDVVCRSRQENTRYSGGNDP